MDKRYSRVRRRKKNKLKRIVLSIILLFSFMVAGIIISRKIYINRNVVVTASNNIINFNKSFDSIDLEENEDFLYSNINLAESQYRRKNLEVLYSGVQKKNTVITSQEDFDKDIYTPNGKKIAYLTFDDGPTPNNTPRILDILKKNNIKATFFVIGNLAEKNKEILKREYNEGHAIGNHTYTHMIYGSNNIYRDTSVFMQDLNKGTEIIKNILGDSYECKLIRFPGGIFSNDIKKQPFVKAVVGAGYHYANWNALNGDAEGNGNNSKDKLIARFKETSINKEHLVILMHDAAAKETTVQALSDIIEYLQKQGYEFKTLY